MGVAGVAAVVVVAAVAVASLVSNCSQWPLQKLKVITQCKPVSNWKDYCAES